MFSRIARRQVRGGGVAIDRAVSGQGMSSRWYG